MMFKGKKGAALASEIGKRSKTFIPGGDLNKITSAQSEQDKMAIKVSWLSLIVFIVFI